jgi:outer membrane receptor protein involved in Fe transport
LGGTYSGKWGADEEFVGRISLDADQNATYHDRTTNETSKQAVQWGALGTAAFEEGTRHKFRLNFMANRDWEDEVTRVFGRRESDNDTSLLFEIATVQQTLLNGQLEGEHRLAEDGTKATWMAALTGASRWEPDRRVSKYFLDDPADSLYDPEFPYLVGATLGLQDRFWFDLGETGWGGKVDLEKPVAWGWFQEGTKARAGLFAFSKSREFDVHRLSYFAGASLAKSPLKHGTYENYMGAFNGASDSGYITNRNQKEKDSYEVEDFQWAAHAQGDWVLSDSWRAIAGARFIQAHVAGKAHSPRGELSPPEAAVARCRGDDCDIPFGYDETALLPAASLVYALTSAQNLRVAWTRTFSFPEYREMAPLLFFSYQEALETVGNIDLKPTDIQNYDLRWEWFPSAGELVALSGFYKNFENPVESRIRQISSNNRGEFVNAPSAELYGIESELRFGFERFHEILSPFQALANFTWIHSEVQGQRKRAMQGQSPYLINAILFLELFGGGSQMSLLYNRFGRRIAKVGVDIFPDVYEEARESLEFSYSQKYGKRLKSKFTAKNLTDAEVLQTQGGLTTKKVQPGRTYSFGFSYAF